MSFSNLFQKTGERIAELRGELTQAEFAKRLGVDRKTVGRWEAGERLPDGASLLKFMQEFHADINYILTEIDNDAASKLGKMQAAISKDVDSGKDAEAVIAGARARSAMQRREIEILNYFRAAPESGKQLIEATAKMAAGSSPSSKASS